MANISAIKLPDGITYDLVDRVSKDIFIAEYGVTTYDELYDAFFGGKTIILKWQSAGYDRYFPVSTKYTSSSFILTFLMGKSIAYDVQVTSFDPPLDWSYSSRNLQETLVSGTNIKTINNSSLLGSGNIDTKDVFIAECGVTPYSDVYDAYIAHKQIILKYPLPNDYFYTPCSAYCSGAGSTINLWFLFAWSVSDSLATRVELTPNNNWSVNDMALQEELVSGTNIKTINGTTLLGSGDITVATGGTSVPIADEVAEFDSDAQMNSTDMSSQDVDDFIDDLSVVGSLIDLFYPVGSYYETSDATFNPNTEWGGTWELETEGQVHIGAGTNYMIDGALINSTDGGEEKHTLTTSESYYPARISTSLTISSTPVSHSGTARYAPTVADANKWTKYSAHTASAHNNMQPYIIVNRWHRTA